MMVGDLAMICEGIISKTCNELDIEIIEIAVNPDHVHIFFKYPPKYSLSFIAKRLKDKQDFKKGIPASYGAEIISGLRVVSMGRWVRDGRWWRSIY